MSERSRADGADESGGSAASNRNQLGADPLGPLPVDSRDVGHGETATRRPFVTPDSPVDVDGSAQIAWR